MNCMIHNDGVKQDLGKKYGVTELIGKSREKQIQNRQKLIGKSREMKIQKKKKNQK